MDSLKGKPPHLGWQRIRGNGIFTVVSSFCKGDHPLKNGWMSFGAKATQRKPAEGNQHWL